jgi:hypothetical protein
MDDNSIKLTREELYEKVWSTPATKLAKEFGISDVALGKICKKLHIPKPYPGYWQQLTVGRRVHKEKLPPIKQGIPAMTVIHPHQTAAPFQPEDPQVLARIEQESQPGNSITIAETLHSPHPLVRQTKQILEKGRPDDYGMLRWSWSQRCLNVRVSKTELHRALRIMDSLLKALEARGYSVEVSKEDAAATYILLAAEKLKVHLSEKANRNERELTAAEKSKPSYQQPNRWVYSPSGRLTFEIDEYCGGCQKKWVDKAQKPLEDQLNEVLAGLIITAEAIRLQRIEREEQLRRRKEEERRRAEEQERRHHLERHIESWSQSQRVREFIRACEETLIERKGEIEPDSAEGKWLRRARQYADRIDPLTNGSFDEAILHLIRKAESP